MRIGDKYKKRLAEIIARLRDARILEPDKSVSFRGFQLEFINSVLESAVDFNPAIPEADRPALIRDGVFKACKDPALDERILQNGLKLAENEYLRKPLQPYVLASAFGISSYHGRKTARINDVRISFLDALPPRFDRAEIQELIEENVPPQPSNIIQVLARVSARTPTAAFDRATASMDLLRALWNFLLTSGKYSLFRSGAPRPANSILPGPLHTLHRPDGSIIRGTFWFEPQGLNGKYIYGADKNWPQTQKKAYRLLSRLRSIKYRADLERAFVRYVRTLDTTDYATAFSGMWSVLERLTNSTGDYGRLIERVLFVTPDTERTFSRLLLEHLRVLAPV